MFRRFASALTTGVLVAASFASGPVEAQNYRQPGVYPVFDGWTTLPDGSLEFYFGYMNRHPKQVTIPLGADNSFDPAPADLNQPTNFLPGRQEHVFTVTKPKGWNGKMVWSLKSEVGLQKATASTDQLYILEIEEEDPGVHVVPPDITARDVSGNVGQPIALGATVKATAQAERVIEGSGPRNAGLTVSWNLHRGPGEVTFAPAPGAPVPAVGDRTKLRAQASGLRAQGFELFLSHFPNSGHLVDDKLAVAVHAHVLDRAALAQLLMQEAERFDQGLVFRLIVGHLAATGGIVAPFQQLIAGRTADVKAAITLAGVWLSATVECNDIGGSRGGKRGRGAGARLPHVQSLLTQAAVSSRTRASAFICSARLGGTGW